VLCDRNNERKEQNYRRGTLDSSLFEFQYFKSFLLITSFSNLCFGQFLCPSSAVFHYTHSNGMSYSLRAGPGRNCSAVLILLASCQETCMTYTIDVCTVKNSWWRTQELSETCTVLLQKYIWEISASSWFYYKNKILSLHCAFWNLRSSLTNKCTIY